MSLMGWIDSTDAVLASATTDDRKSVGPIVFKFRLRENTSSRSVPIGVHFYGGHSRHFYTRFSAQSPMCRYMCP